MDKPLPDSPDALVEVYFFTRESGGRSTPISSETFRCILTHEQESHSCALMLGNVRPISPGDTITVPILFLFPQHVVDWLKPGAEFLLKEARNIAKGRVISVDCKGKPDHAGA